MRFCTSSLTCRTVLPGWFPANLMRVDKKFLHFFTWSSCAVGTGAPIDICVVVVGVVTMAEKNTAERNEEQ